MQIAHGIKSLLYRLHPTSLPLMCFLFTAQQHLNSSLPPHTTTVYQIHSIYILNPAYFIAFLYITSVSETSIAPLLLLCLNDSLLIFPSALQGSLKVKRPLAPCQNHNYCKTAYKSTRAPSDDACWGQNF